MKGYLKMQGWGAAMGFPGLVPDAAGEEVRGLLFSAANLSNFWATLDNFEGEQYERVLVVAYLQDGSAVEAYVYVLRRS